ncbi:hypothetical protein KYK29_05115 [Shinella daejeonensis]|uniref:hypothetical protein n=1 Tax=Shinella daejeonensis TaxID=659017 RepID=UPI0020C7DCD5|nr:hypothetical protein [Shinella daejeonensis]MCP8894301.1 hypothetical protein [Shinella daejeonensis]
MKTMRYRLTKLGWLGAAMFVLPTPLAAWEYHGALSRFANRSSFEQRLEDLSGVLAVPEFSSVYFTTLATASLAGAVLLLIGREIVEVN